MILSQFCKRNIVLITSALAFCLPHLNAQQRLIYDGNFNISDFHVGIAKYEYYERNFERIYDGFFSFKGDYGIKINGHFKNNLKTSVWTYSQSIKGGDFLGLKFKGHSILGKGVYKNGLKQGKWTYLSTEEGTNKVLVRSSAMFRNDTLIGKMDYEEYEKDWVQIKCNFDSLGLVDGDCITRFKDSGVFYEEIQKFSHGSLLFSLFRNVGTGEVICKDDTGSKTCNSNTSYWCEVYRGWSYPAQYCSKLEARDERIWIFHSFLFGNYFK